MEISTKTMAGKTGLQIEALIKEAYESGERNFTSDLPKDLFDPSSIGSTQWGGEGTPCIDWGFNVGEWDLVAARVSPQIKGTRDHDDLVTRLYGAPEEQLSEIAYLILLARLSCTEMVQGDAEMSEENVESIGFVLDKIINQ